MYLIVAQQSNQKPTHVFIPDTQTKAGVPFNHLLWLSEFLVELQPDVIVLAGDHWDMPSLSEYDKGKKKAEGRTYYHDIEAGNFALDLLMSRINRHNAHQRSLKQKLYKPRLIITLGNHEERILRHIEANRHLEYKIGYHDFNLKHHNFEVYDFLEIVEVDGIHYTHFVANPNTGRPITGAALLRLKNVGFTFVMGHQQGMQTAERYLQDGKTRQRCVIAGSFYLHEEEYKGPQGNPHWRGVFIFRNCAGGWFDKEEISIEQLEEWFYAKYPKASRKPIVFKP